MGRARKGTCRRHAGLDCQTWPLLLELIVFSCKLYLLAEILKAAPIPSHVLYGIIRDSNIQPKWNDIALPTGTCPSTARETAPPPRSMVTLDAGQPPSRLSLRLRTGLSTDVLMQCGRPHDAFLSDGIRRYNPDLLDAELPAASTTIARPSHALPGS